MIYQALSIIRSQLEQFIRLNSSITNTQKEVVLGNIALTEGTQGTALTDKVVITLIKLEEDASLKNGQTRFVDGDRIKKVNRPVHSYAYLLFTANYPDSYENALKRLSSIVTFFQGKNTFTYQNSPLTEVEDFAGIEDLKMTLELMSPSFEQLNHVWGMLGGSSHPAVLYKARLIVLERDAPMDYDIPIKHIIINE